MDDFFVKLLWKDSNKNFDDKEHLNHKTKTTSLFLILLK